MRPEGPTLPQDVAGAPVGDSGPGCRTPEHACPFSVGGQKICSGLPSITLNLDELLFGTSAKVTPGWNDTSVSALEGLEGGGRRRMRRKRKRPKRNYRPRRCGTGERVVVPSQVEASSTWHNDHGLWAVDSHNPNCSKGIVDYLGVSSADVYLAQESRVIDADAIKAKQRTAKRAGWNLSVVPSLACH